MNEIELKAQEIKDAMEKSATKIAELEAKLAEIEKKDNPADAEIKGIKEDIQKLNDSIQDFAKELKNKENNVETKGFSQAVEDLVNSEEFKTELKEVVAGSKIKSKKFEIKTDPTSVVTAGLTGDVARTVSPTDIYAAGREPNKFLAACSVRTIGQDKNRASWFDGTYYSNVGYVTELTAMATGDGAALEEKEREIAKIGAFLPFSSETTTDMSYFINWAKNEGVQSVLAEVDKLIWEGDGADGGANTKKIYGIKTQGSTAFSASTAGLALAISAPTLADLIRAMATQIRIQAQGRYNPNMVFLHPANVAKLYMLKNTQADYIQVLPNGAMSVYGMAIQETAKITVDEVLVADSSTLQLHVKGAMEMEIDRVASTDSFVMYLRWRGNTVVPSDAKLGNVYVSNITTALAAINVATPTTTVAPTTTGS